MATEVRTAGEVDAEALDAIAHGRHGDAFAVLGPHAVDSDQMVVRTFLPWAERVELIHRGGGEQPIPLARVHGGGIFEAVLEGTGETLAYHFLVNGELRVEDPYRFPSTLKDDDIYLFNEGTAEHVYRWMGAHTRCLDGVEGVAFAVWAPAASRVSVVGDFNGWDGRQHVMRRHPASGIWDIFLPGIGPGAHYKFEIIDGHGRLLPLKADPYARAMEHPPGTASRVMADTAFPWRDQAWLGHRDSAQPTARPVSIYEVHLGSWRRQGAEGNRYLSYAELAEQLIPHVLDMGFTHVELMPVSEFPFDGSWGYQPLGMYAPSTRFGTPDEFRHFVDQCHRNGIGVLLDWVPGHFPSDPHGLGRFDGTCLYEHEDARKGFHPDWNTLIYNFDRPEVVSYLLGNANYWLEEFHVDGLRVDAVASMLYLDYSRQEHQWIPNSLGGRENLEAIDFLRDINTRLYGNHPGIMMIAEESTAWPGVSRPVHQGGLGFGFKWNMGWMNDTLRYMGRDPVHRKYHHNEMTFSMMYAWDEHFVLPLSHDEVVHGKGSLLSRMPGDHWQQFANLRAYLAFMWGHPGKKLLFMGGEFAQRREWNHDEGLDWYLLDDPAHRGIQHLVRDLNGLYKTAPALHELDSSPDGFQWLQVDNRDQSIFAWLRWGAHRQSAMVVLVNMTPRMYRHHRLGVPASGRYREVLNTDALIYGGSGQGNLGVVSSTGIPWDNQGDSIVVTVPPLAALFLEYG